MSAASPSGRGFFVPQKFTKRVMEAGVYDTRNDVTGYAIVAGKKAAKMFVGDPHLEVPSPSIDVLEIVDDHAY